MSLLNRSQINPTVHSLRLGQRQAIKEDKQFVKVEVCNVDTYLGRDLLSSQSSSSYYLTDDIYTQKAEEIFYEKCCSLATRSHIKLYDIFDMFYSEAISHIDLTNIDQELFRNKIQDQQIPRSILKEVLFKNRSYVLPTRQNARLFLESMEGLLTYYGYKAVRSNSQKMLLYGQDRIHRLAQVLSGKKWQDPWNENKDPVRIAGIADELLNLYNYFENDLDLQDNSTVSDDTITDNKYDTPEQ